MTGAAIPHIARMTELEAKLDALFSGVTLLDRRLKVNHILAAEKKQAVCVLHLLREKLRTAAG